jgi:hypothetical protein
MRFFTLDWWIAQQQFHDRPPDPFDSYKAHFASIEHALPRDLIELDRHKCSPSGPRPDPPQTEDRTGQHNPIGLQSKV